ncbi:hypothetical protein [Pseudomonas sp. HN2-3]|uniref:hypothetical protein n=1 Tax=Pseudomonas sp. HN2-3 TaxID=2886360 RepID=UPI001D11374E|nr:hypothetical protein [Pseudomonas sp. HN2-3]UDU81222.1 hypothetical protein LJX93_26190 [Pseudomonas sp. HN2-3]
MQRIWHPFEMSCRNFFDGLPEDGPESKKRSEMIDEAYPGGFCQVESVSGHSPGVVAGNEFLHRFVFSPIHIDEKGELTAAFFADCATFGLSCQRSDVDVPDAETNEIGAAMIESFNANRAPEKPERSYLGVVTAKCDDVRMLRTIETGVTPYDQAVMAVYDTSLADNTRHADVFQFVPAGVERSKLKQIRRDLALVFTRSPRYA